MYSIETVLALVEMEDLYLSCLCLRFLIADVHLMEGVAIKDKMGFQLLLDLQFSFSYLLSNSLPLFRHLTELARSSVT